MPLKPLAASVFNRNFVDDVVLSVATEPAFTEDGFYNDFFKMLGHFYGNIVGLESASGLCLDQPCRRCVSQGNEFNKAAQAPQAPPQAPAAPAPAARENGASPVDEPPTSLACEGAEAGDGDPAPCEGAMGGF